MLLFLADMLLHMVANKMAGMEADIAANKKIIFLLFLADMLLHMVADMGADRKKNNLGWHGVGHGGRQGGRCGRHVGWSRVLIGPNFFVPKFGKL